jgi:phage gp36-like protein
MKRLLAPTDESIKVERTRLAADAAAGSNVALTVENSDGYADDAYVVIGHEGSELAELEQINQAVSSSTSVRVATLKFNHQAGEPVIRYRYNQRKFYGATTKTGSYTELTGDGSPKTIQADDPQGTVLEYTGSTYTYFKATYYNTETTEESAIADAEAFLGNESTRYAPLWEIRKHAGLAGNPRYSDLNIEKKRVQAENEINSTLVAKYVLPLSEVPGVITNICVLLAAGYIDYEVFGKDGEGAGWLASARAQLKAIQKGTQALIGEDGTELTRQSKVGVLDGYPNDEDTDEANFSMADRF